ncbi:HAD family hydrolase [Tannerella sp.]|uniref:HAD family hydrolase n=1 Tax=Tannerella sp. TaxID=2382127 RepID=UPI0026DBFF4E|nr:HAD family hydrolase [Tannerella sp.]MDO4702987.1 HAD family hydrolase [Tannerella sp.]
MRQIQSVIFDLDGTLLDTIADLAHSTNYALRQMGFPAHPVEAYKYFVGNGINKLFERALPEDERTQDNVLRVREVFLPYYDEHNADYTRPYEGISDLFAALQAEGIVLSVASNKYQRATEKLVRTYFQEIRFAAVFGQRQGIPVKPDPTIVHDILKITGRSVAETIYVGDSGVDMQTAANAGVVSVGVTWGFRPRTELNTHGARYIVDTAEEIRKIIVAV